MRHSSPLCADGTVGRWQSRLSSVAAGSASSLADRTVQAQSKPSKNAFMLSETRTLSPDRIQRNDLIPEEIQCILAKGSPPNKEPVSKPGAGTQPQALAQLSVPCQERCW